MPRLSLAASLAVLLVAAFMLGRLTSVDPGESTGPVPAQVRERILLVAVGDHLERSQRLLIEVLNAEGNGNVDIGAQRERATRLASNNRLYRRTAKRSGDEPIAGFLDELERTLLEIANGPPSLASHQLDDLRRRIARRGILLKIRVLEERTRLDGAVSPPPADEV